MIEEKKKILGPIEWFALLAGLGILGYITLNQAGYKLVERSVEVEFIDPAKTNQLKAPGKKQSKTEKKVDRMLADMAATFKRNATGDSEDLRKETIQQKWGLSEHEAGFYNKLRQSVGENDKLKTATDWFQLLHASRRTYDQLQNLVETLSPEQHNGANPEDILNNESSQKDFYAQLKDWYNISLSDLEAFAARGENSIEDWATYLTLQSFRQN